MTNPIQLTKLNESHQSMTG